MKFGLSQYIVFKKLKKIGSSKKSFCKKNKGEKNQRARFLRLGEFFFFLSISFLIEGCFFSYLTHVGSNQAKILFKRVPLDQVLKESSLDEKNKKKLRLINEVLIFSKERLHLKVGKNYSTYVDLKRPYVSYVLRVAHAYELKPYLWKFPLVGKLPYKGFFNVDRAQKEALKFDDEKYDTYVRGVSAYSSLGWWSDPVLSSFLKYRDEDLVDLIIHELLHHTLFIKGHADFNERLATAVAQRGVFLFYFKKEGAQSETLLRIQKAVKDRKVFSQFISKELDDLKKWYLKNKASLSREKKNQRLLEIQKRFEKDLKKNLLILDYDFFSKMKLNNARLLSFKTYIYDLSDFEFLFQFYQDDFKKILDFLNQLKSKSNPELFLKTFVQENKNSSSPHL